MVSKFGLLTSLLLTSAALAAPSSRLGSRLARRRENRQSRTLERVEALAGTSFDSEYSTNWAGAMWNQDQGTFTTITGTFTVPTPSGSPGSAAAAWVGIDGSTCGSAILQTGVDFSIDDYGDASYDAWYEWYPDASYDFDGFEINPGDIIQTTVTAYSTTNGIAIIENMTSGQQVSKQLSSSSALCQQDAEWIVEDFEENGSLVPFANFGTVTFSDATASGPDYTYTPSGANTIDIQQNNEVLASTSVDGSSVTVTYQ